jgi:chorismate mutase
MEMGAEEEEELPGMRDMYEGTEDQIVNEVAQRVVARLTKQKKGEDLAEQLAAKILKRITSK